MKLPSYVKQIISLLEGAGHEAYAVGGCVRDALLSRPCSDYDVTTSATPDEVKRALASITVIETGIQHGTVTAVLDKKAVEITTFREDLSYSDHRRPDEVKFSNTLEADLARRDFTINALAYNQKSGIIDLYGGKTDLENGVIRAVGDADARFNEDALRILRALRFSSQLGFEVEGKTADAMLKNSALLSFVSKERIYSELKKAVLGKNAAAALSKFRGIIFFVLPSLNSDKFDLSLSALSLLPEDFALRFACLFYFAPTNAAADALHLLRAERKTIDEVKALLAALPIRAQMSRTDVKFALSKLGEDVFFKLIELEAAFADGDKKAELNKTKATAESIIECGECYKISDLEISGKDLLELKIEGREIGKVLEKLLASVTNGETPNDKAKLIEKAKLL